MRRLLNFAREINWLAVASMFLLIAAIALFIVFLFLPVVTWTMLVGLLVLVGGSFTLATLDK